MWCRWIGWWLPRGGRGWVRSQLQENYICLHQPPHPHTHQQHATPPTFQNEQHFFSWPFNHVKNIFLTSEWESNKKFSDKVFLVCRYQDHGWCSIIVATYLQPHLINIADHWTNQPANNPIFYYADTFPSMIDLNHLPTADYLYTFRIKKDSFGHVDLDWTYSIIGGKGRNYQFF